MNDRLIEGSSGSSVFALVVLKSHVSQNLLMSLSSFHGLDSTVSDLYVLHGANCAPDQAESVELARLGVRTHVREVDINRISETLNAVLASGNQDVFVFCRAGDQLSTGFFDALTHAVFVNPNGSLFYPSAVELDIHQEPVRYCATLAPNQITANSDMSPPCVFTGLTIRKAHFLAMGGFHTGCQVIGEQDFWLRTYLVFPKTLVHLPEIQVQVQKPDSSWVLAFGARQLLEWCTLVRQFAGWCGASSMLEYANQLESVAGERPDIKPGLHEHLCDMANRLLFMTNPAERHVLQPWLQNSICIPTIRPELTAVDEVFNTEWRAPSIDLPNLYAGGFSIHSLGSFCHAAQVLKDLSLRQHTGPFDWIFSNAAAATHMFTDRFKTFLDESYFKLVSDEEKVDLASNVCDHLYYKENYGVKFMFNHHKPFEKKDGDFFRDAVQAIQSDLDGALPCILFHIARMNGKPEDFMALWDSLSSYEAPKRLFVVRLVNVVEEKYLTEPVRLVRHSVPDVLEFHLPVVSKTNGLHFADARDNRRLKRLVYSYAQLAFKELTKSS